MVFEILFKIYIIQHLQKESEDVPKMPRALIETRSGLRESPVMKDGDRKEGGSASKEAYLTDDRDLARYERTEL